MKFLYFIATILAFIAALVDSEQSTSYIILACMCTVLFKLQIIEEKL